MALLGTMAPGPRLAGAATEDGDPTIFIYSSDPCGWRVSCQGGGGATALPAAGSITGDMINATQPATGCARTSSGPKLTSETTYELLQK